MFAVAATVAVPVMVVRLQKNEITLHPFSSGKGREKKEVCVLMRKKTKLGNVRDSLTCALYDPD